MGHDGDDFWRREQAQREAERSREAARQTLHFTTLTTIYREGEAQAAAHARDVARWNAPSSSAGNSGGSTFPDFTGSSGFTGSGGDYSGSPHSSSGGNSDVDWTPVGSAIVFLLTSPFRLTHWGIRKAFHLDKGKWYSILTNTALWLGIGAAFISANPNIPGKITPEPMKPMNKLADLFLSEADPFNRGLPVYQASSGASKKLGVVVHGSCMRLTGVSEHFVEIALQDKDGESVKGYVPLGKNMYDSEKTSSECFADFRGTGTPIASPQKPQKTISPITAQFMVASQGATVLAAPEVGAQQTYELAVKSCVTTTAIAQHGSREFYQVTGTDQNGKKITGYIYADTLSKTSASKAANCKATVLTPENNLRSYGFGQAFQVTNPSGVVARETLDTNSPVAYRLAYGSCIVVKAATTTIAGAYAANNIPMSYGYMPRYGFISLKDLTPVVMSKCWAKFLPS